MFLTHIKTLLVQSINTTFDETYPVEQFQGLQASLAFPEKPADYPSVWVDFDVQRLTPVGVDTHQFTSEADGFRPYKTWKFEGRCSFTLICLSAYERDGLYDEMVKVLAFGNLNNHRYAFRKLIDQNQYIRTIFNWDQIATTGMSAMQGTPWGTMEMMYEVTISMDCYGEFSSDLETGALLPLEAITVEAIVDDAVAI